MGSASRSTGRPRLKTSGSSCSTLRLRHNTAWRPSRPCSTLPLSASSGRPMAGRSSTALNRQNPPDTGDLEAVAFDVETGERQETGRVAGVVADERRMAAREQAGRLWIRPPTMNTQDQLWHLQYPGSARRRITNDQSSDLFLSASRDGSMVTAYRTSFARYALGCQCVRWRGGESVAVGSEQSSRDISYRRRHAGLRPPSRRQGQPLVGQAGWQRPEGKSRRPRCGRKSPASCPGAIRWSSEASGQIWSPHIWRVDTDGTNLVRLTHRRGRDATGYLPGRSRVSLQDERRRHDGPSAPAARRPIQCGQSGE